MNSNLQYSMCLMELSQYMEKYGLEPKPLPIHGQFSDGALIYSNPISMKSLAYPYSCELEFFSKLAAKEMKCASSNKLEKQKECGSIKSVMQNFKTSSMCDEKKLTHHQSEDYPTVKKLQTMCDLATSVENTNSSPNDDTQLSLNNILQTMGEENTLHSASQNFFYSSLLLKACKCLEADKNYNSKPTKMKRSHPAHTGGGQEHNTSSKQATKCTKHARVDDFPSCQALKFPRSSLLSAAHEENNLTDYISTIVQSPSDKEALLLEDDDQLKMNLPSCEPNRTVFQGLRCVTRSPDVTIASKTENLLKMYLCSKKMCNNSEEENAEERVLSGEKSSLRDDAKFDVAGSNGQSRVPDKTIGRPASKLSRLPELIPFSPKCLKNITQSLTSKCSGKMESGGRDDSAQSADDVVNVGPTLTMAGLLSRLNIGPEHSEPAQLDGSKDCSSSLHNIHPHCFLCDIQFTSSVDLQHHILIHHTTRGAHGKVRD